MKNDAFVLQVAWAAYDGKLYIMVATSEGFQVRMYIERMLYAPLSLHHIYFVALGR